MKIRIFVNNRSLLIDHIIGGNKMSDEAKTILNMIEDVLKELEDMKLNL